MALLSYMNLKDISWPLLRCFLLKREGGEEGSRENFVLVSNGDVSLFYG